MTSRAETTKERYAAELEAALNNALAHPLRHRVLAIVRERPASPTEIANELGESREKVAYHIRYLSGQLKDRETVPLIELVKTDNRHGGREHFYRAIVRPIIDTPASKRISRLKRELLSAAGADLVLEDMFSSIEAGIFDQYPERSLLRQEVRVDEEGFEKTGEILLRALDELTTVEEESVARLAKSGGDGIPLTTALLAYPKA